MPSSFELHYSFELRHSDFVILQHMTPAQLQTIEEIFRAALDQEPERIGAFLEAACEGDEVLRRKIEALLASRDRVASFMETSAVGLATKIIQNGERDSLIGHTIGHYKISEPIGTGGMGEVYLATDVTSGRKAALKLLPTRFAHDTERLKRFQQEAHAVVALNHPNILTIYEIGEDHSTHYIVSELIEGETLRQHLTHGGLELSEAVDVAIQVASAIAAAHAAGVVHRDVKPENIMRRPDGYVKILDFGIAKLAEREVPVTTPRDEALLLVETNLGSILGTVRYMSPEQACGAPVDKRTDIWSLGVVLYETITGHTPFTGDTPEETMSAILETEPRPVTSYLPRTPIELQQIISKSLRKNPAQRYQSAHELVEALKGLRHKLEDAAELERSTAARSLLRRTRSRIALALVLLIAALAVALPFYWHRKLPTTLPSDKSVAVLPFENLSEEKENAFFAAGVQDEILSDLAKVADLKVISRTSVMKYKNVPERDLREIAKTLGVSYVLEGSVQRAGGRVRVSAQLIDARSDAHVWAEHYDRDVADVLAVQTELARQIADQLKANLSPAEKAAIAERPTADLVAYAYYTKAKEIDVWGDWEGAGKSMARKVELLEKATQRDPNFALAYCALAKTQVYLAGDVKHLELAKKAAEAALRVRPDLGEGHLELARYYFNAGVFTNDYNHDYDRARDELAIVRRKLPNNAEALWIEAMIGRHENRWDDSLANLQKANALDPRNSELAWDLGRIYFAMRRYSQLEQLITKDATSGIPQDPWAKMVLAEIKLAQGDPVAAQSLLEQVPLDFSPDALIWGVRFAAALYLRDYDAANRVIAATPAKGAPDVFDEAQESWGDGLVARARGDKQKALAVFAAARKKVDATWGDKPKDSGYLSLLARLDAGLGQKEEAIREARRAVELQPIAKDSVNGPTWVANLALVYAWTGERDRAREQLEKVAKIPNGPTYGDLRFNPCWDDLRGDKRFDKIVAATKTSSR
jgi:serine/threonine protein kinase